jgi:hypothetical protein
MRYDEMVTYLQGQTRNKQVMAHSMAPSVYVETCVKVTLSNNKKSVYGSAPSTIFIITRSHHSFILSGGHFLRKTKMAA